MFCYDCRKPPFIAMQKNAPENPGRECQRGLRAFDCYKNYIRTPDSEAEKYPAPENPERDCQRGLRAWRRKRDLNPRAGFPTYSLSRGAPSPLGYFCKCRFTRYSVLPKAGGEGGIRTHGPLRDHRFSRPAP